MEKDWENFSDEWSRNIFYNPKKNYLLRWLRKLGKKEDVILDQGCGIGQYAFTIYKMGFREVIGIDFSEKLISNAKKINSKLKYKCKFVTGDIRKMPFSKERFDMIMSAGIIEHVKETDIAFKELNRTLKKGGILLIHVPHKISIFTLLKKFQQVFGLWKLGYEKSFSVFQFKKLLKNNGFKILDYKISRFYPGKHKIIGKIIQIVDEPLYQMRFGGHHMSFVCKKIF